MKEQDIIRLVDHTILRPACTWREVQHCCDEAVAAEAASVCLSPIFVARAAEYLGGRLPICTVVGFPHGAVKSVVKWFEADRALKAGAEEIDMVLNLSWVKDAHWTALREELRALRAVTRKRVLKVIVETCYLTEDEKRRLCDLVAEAEADFIKTSTGFGTGGATVEDVRLFRETLPDFVKIKASGGVRSFDDARAMLQAGADRLGSSALVPLYLQQQKGE